MRRIGISVGGVALLIGATLWTTRATDTPPTSRLVESGALVGSFARQGRGPGEVSSPRGLQRDPDNAALVWVYDVEQRRLVGVDVASGSAPLNRPIGEAGSLLTPMLRQGTIIANGLFQDYSLVVLDSLGKPIGRSDVGVPFAPPEVSSVTAQRLLNVSTLAYAPLSRSRLVPAYQFPRASTFSSSRPVCTDV